MKISKNFFLRLFAIAGLLALISGISGATYYFADPVSFRKAIYHPIREFLYFQKELGAITNWSKVEKNIISPAKKITIPPNDAGYIKIIADLWLPDDKELSPAVLLLHGSSPWGRKNGLILQLASEFQKAGWIVLTPDARGFGESGDPEHVTDPHSWTVKDDIRRCMDYLSAYPRVDGRRIYVLGHSRGAGHALEGALGDPRVKALVLVGPTRYLNGVNTSHWWRVRFSAVRGLKTAVSPQVLQVRAIKTDIALYAKSHLNSSPHPPLLIVDGEHEGSRKLEFLSKITTEISPPIDYRTLRDTGHYCGVYNLFGSEAIYYRPDMFDPFMNVLFEFIQNVESGNI